MKRQVVNRKPTGCLRRLGFHLLVLLLLAAACWAGTSFFLRRREAELLYRPRTAIAHTPHEFGLDFQRVEFHSADNSELSGWWIPAARPRGTVLFFHGESGNMGSVVKWAPWFNRRRFNVFLWDPRGYGQSAGKPNERGLCRDADAALDAVLQMNRRLSPSLPVVLFGHSLGASLALHAASKHPDAVAGLVLEAPFPSVDDLLGLDFPGLPVRWMVSQHYDSAALAPSLSGIPKLVGHSPDDELVPFSLGVRFARNFTPPPRFVTLAGLHDDHDWLRDGTPSSASLAAFLDGILEN